MICYQGNHFSLFNELHRNYLTCELWRHMSLKCATNCQNNTKWKTVEQGFSRASLSTADCFASLNQDGYVFLNFNWGSAMTNALICSLWCIHSFNVAWDRPQRAKGSFVNWSSTAVVMVCFYWNKVDTNSNYLENMTLSQVTGCASFGGVSCILNFELMMAFQFFC